MSGGRQTQHENPVRMSVAHTEPQCSSLTNTPPLVQKSEQVQTNIIGVHTHSHSVAAAHTDPLLQQDLAWNPNFANAQTTSLRS